MDYALKILNNFNFEVTSFNIQNFHEDLFEINKKLDLYLKMGWRERLLASYTIAYFERNDYKIILEDIFIKEFLDRDLKGFVVAIIKLFNKDDAKILLTNFLTNRSDSIQINWVIAGLSILENDTKEKTENQVNKINQALKIINQRPFPLCEE